FDDAIRALAVLRERGIEPRLAVVGDGPEREPWEALARQLGVAEQVDFLGTLVHEQLLPLYRRAWLLLAPSKVTRHGRRDGIPNVVREARARGVPGCGSDAPGVGGAMVPDETGLLVPPRDPAALADAIAALLADESRLDELGPAARRRATEHFDAARNFDRL